jgi:hypothetical protein
MVLHTFGDSHCANGWAGISVFVHHLGAKLCFSVGRDGIDITGTNVNNGDTVVFCFGEIDCRCHIHKHVSARTSYKQIIDTIVDRYFIQIKLAVDKFENLKTVVYNVVPPVQQDKTPDDPEYPFIGTDEERKSYVLYFNEKLQEKCDEYKYVFLNIYDSYVDNNGYLEKSLSDGRVHISDSFHLKRYIENNLM